MIHYLSGAALGLAVLAATPGQTATIAEYLFDGTANDSSGNGEHLALSGDATFATGMHGQALSLDGAGDYAFTGFSDYGLTQFTVEAWIKSADVGRNVHYVSLHAGQYIVLGDYGVANVSTWAEGLSPTDMGSGSVSQTLFNDTWYHLAFTYDGSTQRFYIDGELAGAAATSGTLDNGFTGGLTIGARYTGTTQYVDGLIDTVRISDRALARSELGFFTDGVAAVPLPAGGALLLGGLFGLGALRRRSRS
jgi:hypothetical protein